MKISTKNSVITGMLGCLLVPVAYAGTPVWTYSAPNPASVSVSTGSTVTVQYTVTNQSSKPKNLKLKARSGLSASPCYLAAKGSTCTLTLTVNGSQIPTSGIHGGPMLCEGGNSNQCYQPALPNQLNVTLGNSPSGSLTPSVTSLALSVKNNTSTPTLPGTVRLITLRNQSAMAVNNVSIGTQGLPSDTTVSPQNCGTLAPGDSCTLTVTPGTVASSSTNPAGTDCSVSYGQATAGQITVSAANASPLSIDTYVLGYGCQYQGGFVFSIDDSTPTAGSIGGKVASLTDQAAPWTDALGAQTSSIIWSSNGGTAPGNSDGYDTVNVSYDLIPGVDEISASPSSSSPDYSAFETFFSSTYSNTNPWTSSPFSACNGSSDGQCNTGNIITFYNQFITNNTERNGGSPLFTASNGPTSLSYYAAGLCEAAAINGYSDWYLPAICEMDSISGPICPAGAPSMLGTLSLLIGDPASTSPAPNASCNQPDGPPQGTNCLAGTYWSSTEESSYPQYTAWSEYFFPSSGYQISGDKDFQNGVRCVRGF